LIQEEPDQKKNREPTIAIQRDISRTTSWEKLERDGQEEKKDSNKDSSSLPKKLLNKHQDKEREMEREGATISRASHKNKK